MGVGVVDRRRASVRVHLDNRRRRRRRQWCAVHDRDPGLYRTGAGDSHPASGKQSGVAPVFGCHLRSAAGLHFRQIRCPVDPSQPGDVLGSSCSRFRQHGLLRPAADAAVAVDVRVPDRPIPHAEMVGGRLVGDHRRDRGAPDLHVRRDAESPQSAVVGDKPDRVHRHF